LVPDRRSCKNHAEHESGKGGVPPAIRDDSEAQAKNGLQSRFHTSIVTHIIHWNDAPERTWAEIESVLKEARL
jgi:hypothetical protein